MPNCAITGCFNHNRKKESIDVKFYKFPKNQDLALQWVHACRRKKEINLKNAVICSKHFESKFFIDSLKYRLLNEPTPKTFRNLRCDAVPTLFLPKSRTSTSTSNDGSFKLSQRMQARNNLKSQQKIKDILSDQVNNSGLEQTESPALAREVVNMSEPLKEIENMKLKIVLLEKEVALLKSQNKKLRNDKMNSDAKLLKFYDILSNYFTSGQIKRILNPNKKYSSWGWEDIASAISLRSVSPKAYRYLKRNGYPLPTLSTLRRWVLNLKLTPGMLTDVVKLMKQKSTTLNECERLCSLSFDKIHISDKLCVDQREQQVLGTYKTCQVVMIRGLYSQWKQPIFYDFDTPMTKDILFKIITELHYAGYTVVSVTSDVCTENVSIWSQLNVGYEEKCYFAHPVVSSGKIFVFADAPHLLKLIRNHLIDEGFYLDGKFINKSCIQEMISLSNDDPKIAHTINNYHLTVDGSERQRVRPAAQLLSNTVAEAVERCGLQGFLNNVDWKETSQFLKLTNDWFDIFNAQTKYGAHPGVNAFGVDLDKQLAILKEMSKTISAMTVGTHQSLMPFQKGILLDNNSLTELREYLHGKYNNLEHVLTYRLNQDILKNLFSYIRSMGAANDHPTPTDIAYGLRWYILGKNSHVIFSMNENTEDSSESCLLKALKVENVDEGMIETEICVSQELFKNIFLEGALDQSNNFPADGC